jgi:hypothetical protein
MSEIVFFVIGFLIGCALMYFYFKPVHDVLESIDEKYSRLLDILQCWQKKI